MQIDAKSGKKRRYQVKRQQTPLSQEEFAKYFVPLAKGGEDKTEYRFAFPVLIEVTDVGEMHVLRGLCDRVQQKGAAKEKVFQNLRGAERVWIDHLSKWTSLDDSGVYDLLSRFHIDIIGYEADLDTRALRILEPIFGHSTEEVWLKVRDFVSDKDGAAPIQPSVFSKILPNPAGDEIETFYWSLVEEAEQRFFLDSWPGLTDHLIRDLLPIEFRESVLYFVQSVSESVWPGRYKRVEAALKALSEHAHEYISYFDSRSEIRGKSFAEDLSYKRFFPNPNYHKESEAAAKWRTGVQIRLFNMVVSLNELFAAIRKEIRPTYRLRDGKFGIHDSMGVTNELIGAILYPEEIRPLPGKG